MITTFQKYKKELQATKKDFSFLFPISIEYFKFNKDLTIDSENYSIISDIYSEALSNPELNKEVEKYLENISKEDLEQLNKEEIKSIIWIYYFGLKKLPDIYSIFEWEVINRDTYTNFQLKDPLYDYPEANFIKKIKSLSNISINELLSVLEEDIYDYATYSVGDYNWELREEYLDYFENFLKPNILSSKKDLSINNKIQKLEKIRKELELILLDIELFNSFNTENKILKTRRNSLLYKRKKDLKNIPIKYRTLSNIDKKIQELKDL